MGRRIRRFVKKEKSIKRKCDEKYWSNDQENRFSQTI